MALETLRLTLAPSTPQQILTLIDHPERFEEMVDLQAAEGLRAGFVSDEVAPAWLAALRAASEPSPWHHGFFVVHRDTRTVIGSAGFKGPPDDGIVEIAYGIVPRFQGEATLPRPPQRWSGMPLRVGGCASFARIRCRSRIRLPACSRSVGFVTPASSRTRTTGRCGGGNAAPSLTLAIAAAPPRTLFRQRRLHDPSW